MTAPFAPNLQLLYPGRVVFNGGVAGQTSTEIATRELADAGAHSTWINIFWYGQNNEDDPERIKADVAASVASLAPGNTHFIVMSVVNKANADEMKGTAAYGTILRLNSELAAIYPQNYLDIRSFLVSQISPGNAQDLEDFQNDVPPTSLRFDEIHLNNDGSVVVAKRVQQYIDAKGW